MITIIAAVALNGIIGRDNALPWHISEDLRRFRRITVGHPVIMGRRTYESLGRPLPERVNVVVSRSGRSFEGCLAARSFDEAAAMFSRDEEIFVIGGAMLYAEALSRADRLLLTVVEHDYEGDVLFPDYDRGEWELAACERICDPEAFEYPFRFEEYRRRR